MRDATALRLAIDLMLVPSRVRAQRASPLPSGVAFLLQVAAYDEQAMREAVRLTTKPSEVVQAAAAFFIEQILLKPGADSYHILGARPDAAASELRQNLALLLRWLHPDASQNAHRSIFVTRVTSAWNDLKTPERRAAYDLRHGPEIVDRFACDEEWPVDVSAIPEYRSDALSKHDTRRPDARQLVQAPAIQKSKGDGFLHRMLLLLMGEPGD